MSTPTDDYEAMASEWIRDPKNWDMISRINDEGTEGMISTLAAFARSVAHPPTSELVSAAQAVVEWCMHWCERVAPDDSDWTDLRARLKTLFP